MNKIKIKNISEDFIEFSDNSILKFDTEERWSYAYSSVRTDECYTNKDFTLYLHKYKVNKGD